ncbi:replication initiator protein A [Priestia aryabhattai]|uniref:replication initiator protein A n=1 Tax=Priestia aryabhattai TaxID=412384 RepID=UPI001C8E2B3F|nr:replication initiator protein A [Priestia aryabhattai]MBY0077948.1 replication initiator protein A [Priestia aryabhattai]
MAKSNEELNYYKADEEFKEKFYQVPKVFMVNERYIKLSNDAKVAWGILRDRHSLSVKNGWVEAGTLRIYFLYKNDKLCEILNMSEPTVIKVKKELKKAGLMHDRRMGQGNANRMYLLKPVVTEADVYKIQEMENDVEEPAPNTKNQEEAEKEAAEIIAAIQTLKNLSSENRDEAEILASVVNLKNLSSKTKNILALKLKNFKPINTELSDTDFSDTEKNLSITKQIEKLNVPVQLKETLVRHEKKIDRLIRNNKMELNDVKMLFETNELDVKHFSRKLNDVLKKKIDRDFSNYLQTAIDKYIEDANKKKASQPTKQPVRKEAVPEWLHNKKQDEKPKEDAKNEVNEEVALYKMNSETYRKQLTEDEINYLKKRGLWKEPATV